jgi:hypothetical protein
MHRSFALKGILKFILKRSDMFRFNDHHQGACYMNFVKVTVAKKNQNCQLNHIVVVSSVVWPHILSGFG